MKRFVLLALLAMGLATGCGKRQEPAVDTAATPPGQLNARGAPGVPVDDPTLIVFPENVDINVTLSQLSTELHRYVARTRSVPKNFEDFAAKAHVKPPTPPAGKKFAIKDQAVVLARR